MKQAIVRRVKALFALADQIEMRSAQRRIVGPVAYV